MIFMAVFFTSYTLYQWESGGEHKGEAAVGCIAKSTQGGAIVETCGASGDTACTDPAVNDNNECEAGCEAKDRIPVDCSDYDAHDECTKNEDGIDRSMDCEWKSEISTDFAARTNECSIILPSSNLYDTKDYQFYRLNYQFYELYCLDYLFVFF